MTDNEKIEKSEKRVFMKPGRDNKEDRINFVKYWAEYIRTHSDKDWSKQQNMLINSQIKASQSLFRNSFGQGDDFKKNARKYLRKVGVLN